MTDDAEPDLRRRLSALADFLPALEGPDFEAGRWHDSERRGEVWTMPWYELGPTAEAFLRAVVGNGWMMIGFDWPTWASTAEAMALRTDPAALADATPDQIAKLLTALIRSDRFNEGTLGDAFESGYIAAIARRAAALAGDPTRSA